MENMPTLQKMERYKIHIPKDIQIIFLLAVALNLLRVLLFDSMTFIYLLWNIFLAILPFVVSSVLVVRMNQNKLATPLLVIGGIVWMLLLPNAPYIVTDLIHIGRVRGAPVLYDTFLLFSSAWLGMLLFMHSLAHIEKIILEKYGKKAIRVNIPIIILLSSIGVYIGRYLRFNSWDVFNPSLFEDTFTRFTHPTHLQEAVLFIIPCFLFSYLFYRAWKVSSK